MISISQTSPWSTRTCWRRAGRSTPTSRLLRATNSSLAALTSATSTSRSSRITTLGALIASTHWERPDADSCSLSFTVPVVYDSKENKIVNNESSEIIRFLNTAFNESLPAGEKRELDLYPEEYRKEIDELNEWVYATVNNGVYRAGFATTQQAYEAAVVREVNSFCRTFVDTPSYSVDSPV